MIKNVLRAIGGAELYPLISLIIFTLFFAGLVIWALCLRRSYVVAASHLVFDDSTNTHAGE